MGGQGSGRLPSEETIIRRLSERQKMEVTPIGTEIILPNYSGLQAVKKTDSPIGTGTGGVSESVFNTLSGAYYAHAADTINPHSITLLQTNITLSGTAVLTKTTTLNSSGSVTLSGASIGRLACGTSVQDNPLLVETTSTAGVAAIHINQTDQDIGFINYYGTAAGDATKNIATGAPSATLVGFVRVFINGVTYWMPYYTSLEWV